MNWRGSLADLLGRYEFRSRQEHDIQNGIEQVLIEHGLTYRREVALSPGSRPDFLIEGVAVEVKVAGPVLAVARQLQRYAQEPAVVSILLVSTRNQHAGLDRTELAGKPVRVFLIAGSLT